MQSVKLINGDLALENGDFPFVEGENEITQSLALLLHTNVGEWFLNPQLGVHFDTLFSRTASLEEIQQEIRNGILQEERVQSIEKIDVHADSQTRTLFISFVIGLHDQTRIEGGIPLYVG